MQEDVPADELRDDEDDDPSFSPSDDPPHPRASNDSVWKEVSCSKSGQDGHSDPNREIRLKESHSSSNFSPTRSSSPRDFMLRIDDRIDDDDDESSPSDPSLAVCVGE